MQIIAVALCLNLKIFNAQMILLTIGDSVKFSHNLKIRVLMQDSEFHGMLLRRWTLFHALSQC